MNIDLSPQGTFERHLSIAVRLHIISKTIIMIVQYPTHEDDNGIPNSTGELGPQYRGGGL